MPEIANGVHKVLYFRKLGEAAQAAKLVFQTEHSKAASRDRESTPTKDGNVQGSAALEDEISITALQSTDDPTFEMLDDSIYGTDEEPDGYPVEMWEVDLSDKEDSGSGDPTFGAEYRQGYVTEWETTDGSEDNPEISGTFLAYGRRQKGRVTLPEGDLETLSYVFHDVLESDPADDGLADGDTSTTTTTTVA
ncbi:hypothetical protein GCM10007063_05550 [Lentibacillus kapialis]|uniref:Phage major tail protein, TP901-1 family n=1 Tax=Lentibacillus kapialis TaxID=340214 RepID=A0A917UUD3_9BACI|nr:phage major tail protein, TP901-1 family [Lentibacillus kapialis]GGJ85963.1 hypothetical protein GCM10007063_05550 [Lentibacillus kapialis]